jgi:hypothetical protein
MESLTRDQLDKWFAPPRKGGLKIKEFRDKAREYGLNISNKITRGQLYGEFLEICVFEESEYESESESESDNIYNNVDDDVREFVKRLRANDPSVTSIPYGCFRELDLSDYIYGDIIDALESNTHVIEPWYMCHIGDTFAANDIIQNIYSEHYLPKLFAKIENNDPTLDKLVFVNWVDEDSEKKLWKALRNNTIVKEIEFNDEEQCCERLYEDEIEKILQRNRRCRKNASKKRRN